VSAISLEVLDEFRHLNIEFVSLRENIDTGGSLGRAMIVIVSAIAELERSLIGFCPDFSPETSGKRPWSPNFPQPTSDHVGGFAARLPSHDDLRL
jgi:Resolvase, N terminal domain